MNLLVGTTDGVVRLGDQRTHDLAGRSVTDIDATGPDALAIVDGSELHAHRDGRWTLVARGPDDDRLCCVRRTGAGVLVGTAEGHLLRLDDGQLAVVESFEHVEGRDAWWNVGGDLGAHGNVRTLDESDDGTVFVNVHVGGIYRSTDRGRSWTPTIDLQVDVHEVVGVDRGLVVAATGMSGLVRSTDNGDTWTSVTEGLPGTSGYTRSVAVVDPGTVLITGSRGPFSDLDGGVWAGVYRWRADDPDRLERLTHGLPESFPDNIDTGRLVACGLQVAFGAEHTVFASTDAGDTWRGSPPDLAPVRCLAATG